MASTPTTNLRLELMAAGENDDTWGGKANTVFQLIENALTKRTPIALTNSDVTLSTANFADDQARALVLALSGVLTGNVNVIVPALSHFYLVENACTGSYTVTVKTPSGTGIVVAQAKTTITYCNATNVIAPVSTGSDADTLDGLDSAAFAQLAVFGQYTKGSGHTFATIADGGTVTADCVASDRHIVTLGGNRTLAFATPHDGQTIEIWCVQDGTGGRTLAFPSNVRFASGVAPSLSGVAAGLDVLKLTYNLARDEWVCDSVLGLAGGATLGLVLSANESNVSLFERSGSPSGATTVNLTVSAGVVISSDSPLSAALDTSGFAVGSIINLSNRGKIEGKGGDGGDGGSGMDVSDGRSWYWHATAGRAGGNAILGPGAGRTLNITNSAGRIWGGGGGGGGGGFSLDGSTQTAIPNGGGGGAGAGAARGGRGASAANGSAALANGADGGNSSRASSAAAGTGGAGTQTGNADGGNGGNGGDWGTAGTAGESPAGFGYDDAGGAAGAAGKAIEVNGATVSFLSGSGSPNVMGAVS